MSQHLGFTDSSIFLTGFIDGEQRNSIAGHRFLVDHYKLDFTLISSIGTTFHLRKENQ